MARTTETTRTEEAMDSQRFDRIATTLADTQTQTETHSRRGVLRLLTGAALGATGLSLVAPDEGAAKRRKRRKSSKVGSGGTGNGHLPAGAFCKHDDQCAPEKTNRICEVAVNASNSDRTCCGAQGAVCGGYNEDLDAQAPYCCVGYECVVARGQTKGVCQRLPEEV
jgi:hypothetical protein